MTAASEHRRQAESAPGRIPGSSLLPSPAPQNTAGPAAFLGRGG